MKGAALLLMTLAAAFSAQARAREAVSIELSPQACAPLQLVAQDARLSRGLESLAGELHFSLHYASREDPNVTVSAQGASAELLASLLRGRSAGVETDNEPACPGQTRVTAVWVMPRGVEHPPLPMPATASEESPAVAAYRHAHGLDRDAHWPHTAAE